MFKPEQGSSSLAASKLEEQAILTSTSDLTRFQQFQPLILSISNPPQCHRRQESHEGYYWHEAPVQTSRLWVSTASAIHEGHGRKHAPPDPEVYISAREAIVPLRSSICMGNTVDPYRAPDGDKPVGYGLLNANQTQPLPLLNRRKGKSNQSQQKLVQQKDLSCKYNKQTPSHHR